MKRKRRHLSAEFKARIAKEALFRKKNYPKATSANLPEAELDRVANMLAAIWIDKQKIILNA